MTIITDSVLYIAYPDLKREMPRWKLARRGIASLTIPGAEEAIRSRGTKVSQLVVVGLGYNSNWQRKRENYDFWAGHFDRDARTLLRTLRRYGARQIVWVNLREPDKRVTPRRWWVYLPHYAWYFPYVNERLTRVDRQNEDVVLANWKAVSDRRGLTHDAIHLNKRGAALMARTIERAVDREARRQARAAGCS